MLVFRNHPALMRTTFAGDDNVTYCPVRGVVIMRWAYSRTPSTTSSSCLSKKWLAPSPRESLNRDQG